MAIVKKREVLEQSKLFKLSLVQHHKKKWYEMVYYRYGSVMHDSKVNKEVRDYFSPNRDKSLDYMNHEFKWKFKDRSEAMKKYTWANIRWQ